MQSLTGLMADHLAPAKQAALRARPRIAILIPCLDEELTIGGVIEQFRKELPQAKIYVFDNNSTDHTVERAREKGRCSFASAGKARVALFRACFAKSTRIST